MSNLGLGDRAQLFSLTRHNAALRERMATLTHEVSTEQAADPVAHLRGDTAPLADLNRRLALAGDWGRAAVETETRLGLMQDVLGAAEESRVGLVTDLISATTGGTASAHSLVAARAAGVFADVATALNGRAGQASLFSGTATDEPAMSPPGIMMAAIRMAAAGATSAAGVTAALDAWFGPGGGFETTGYLGATTDLTRPVDDGTTIALAARADDPALRGLLKAASAAALAADPVLALPEEEAKVLLASSRDALLSVAAPLTDLRAGLGAAQARVDEAQARHAARASAYAILRVEMIVVDPYETTTALEAVRLQLETHYTLTQRLSQLSLVGFLR